MTTFIFNPVSCLAVDGYSVYAPFFVPCQSELKVRSGTTEAGDKLFY